MSVRGFVIGFVLGAFAMLALRSAGVEITVGSRPKIEQPRPKVDTLQARPEKKPARRLA